MAELDRDLVSPIPIDPPAPPAPQAQPVAGREIIIVDGKLAPYSVVQPTPKGIYGDDVVRERYRPEVYMRQSAPLGPAPLATWRIAREVCLRLAAQHALTAVRLWGRPLPPLGGRVQAVMASLTSLTKACNFTRLLWRAWRDPDAPYARCYSATNVAPTPDLTSPR